MSDQQQSYLENTRDFRPQLNPNHDIHENHENHDTVVDLIPRNTLDRQLPTQEEIPRQGFRRGGTPTGGRQGSWENGTLVRFKPLTEREQVELLRSLPEAVDSESCCSE